MRFGVFTSSHLLLDFLCRHEFLYPSQRQQAAGDSMLAAFDGTTATLLRQNFVFIVFTGGSTQVSRRKVIDIGFKAQSQVAHGRVCRRQEIDIIYTAFIL
jgi:hypothetical protein